MTTASKITLSRVLMIPVYLVTMYLSHGQTGLWMYVSLAIFVVASLTDFVDGYIARHYHQVTDFGKFLDPLADKLLVIAAMCMFCQWGVPGLGADDRVDERVRRHGPAAHCRPEGHSHCRRLERQGQDRQHHGGPVRHDGGSRHRGTQLGGYRCHCSDDAVFRRGIFHSELEVPLGILMVP